MNHIKRTMFILKAPVGLQLAFSYDQSKQNTMTRLRVQTSLVPENEHYYCYHSFFNASILEINVSVW